MATNIEITNEEKEIINKLNHPVYTVDFLSEWINRNDAISVNAFSALQAMGAKGYYQAVQQMCKL